MIRPVTDPVRDWYEPNKRQKISHDPNLSVRIPYKGPETKALTKIAKTHIPSDTGTEKRVLGGFYYAVPIPGHLERCEIIELSPIQTPIRRRHSFIELADLPEIAKQYIPFKMSEEDIHNMVEKCEKQYSKLPDEILQQYPNRVRRFTMPDGAPSCFLSYWPARVDTHIGNHSGVLFLPTKNIRLFSKNPKKTETYTNEVLNLKELLTKVKHRQCELPGYPDGIRTIQSPQEVFDLHGKDALSIYPPGYSMRKHGPELFQVPIRKDAVSSIVGGIWSQLNTMFDMGHLHLDIKSENFCLNSNGEIVAVDIGGAKQLSTLSLENPFWIKYSPDHTPETQLRAVVTTTNPQQRIKMLDDLQKFTFAAVTHEIAVAAHRNEPIAEISNSETLPYDKDFRLKPERTIKENFLAAGLSQVQADLLWRALSKDPPKRTTLTDAFCRK